MKKTVCLCMVFVLLITIFVPAYAGEMYNEQADTTEWIEWENPDFAKRGGTALDASYLLDAPAGKHGFAAASGEDIFFEDGTPARFWGINLVRQAIFPDFVQTERIVNRIAQSGYNLIRFHQYDEYKDVDSLYGGNGPEKPDKKQLNKMHYLISEMKKKGIYLYLDMIVLRDLEEATGSLHGKTGAAMFFNEELINAQKEQAKEILTTVNPYTGLNLADDPVLAFVQLVNETGIFDLYADSMSQYYIDEMHTMFSEWLLAKYTDTTSLKNAWGSDLPEGERLENKSVTFFGDGSVHLSTLVESMGSKKREDIYEFLYDVNEDYYLTMRDFLRELGVKSMITGVGMGGILVTNKNPATVRLNKEHMDFADMHTYMSHPFGPFSMEGTYSEKNSMLFIPDLFKHVTAHRPYNMPFVLSEWQDSNINQYRAEGIPMMAGYACFQNWIPIQFCLNDGYVYDAERAYNDDTLSTYDDPINTVLAPLGAAIYLRHEVDEAENQAFQRTNKKEIISQNFNSVFNDYDDSFRSAKRGIIFDDLPDYNEAVTQPIDYPMGKINDQMTFYYRKPEYSGRNVFSIDSDYTNIVVGFEPGTSYEFGDSIIEYENNFALVGITSVDNEPLTTSKRMLINVVGRAESTGFEYTFDSWSIYITEGGEGPMLAEPVKASLILKTTDDITVYALDSHGRRIGEVSTESVAEGKKILLNENGYKALSYEVIRNNGINTANAWFSQAEKKIEVYGTMNEGGNVSVNVIRKDDNISICSADVSCNEVGDFSKILILDNIPKSGMYAVEVKKNNDVICNKEFEITDLKETYINAVSNFNDESNELSISGTVYAGINPAAERDVTALILPKDINVDDMSVDVLKNSAYDIIKGTTDEVGKFTLCKNIFETQNGEYQVVIYVSAEDFAQGTKKLSQALTFNYNSVEPYLEFKKNGMAGEVYRIDADSGNGIIGVVQNTADDGVLVLAAYKDGAVAEILIEDEKNENGEIILEYIPDILAENYQIKLMYFDSLGKITPLSDFYLLEK